MKKERYLLIAIFLLLNLNSIKPKAEEEEKLSIIDTLILYNQAVEDHYHGKPQTRINHIIEETNQRFIENHLPIKINPVKIQKYEMDNNLSSKKTITKLQSDSQVKSLRNLYGADQVLIYRLYLKKDKSCGIAYVNNGQSAYAFAHVSINCSSYHTSHELGHSIGLYHSEKSNPNVGYARGYGIEDTFETIMAYRANYHGKKIYNFSNPEMECEGLPCGVQKGELHEANAFEALLANAPTVAAFKTHKEYIDQNKILKAEELVHEYKLLYEKYKDVLDRLKTQYNTIEVKYQKKLTQFQPYNSSIKNLDLNSKKSALSKNNKNYLKNRVNFIELYLLEKTLHKLKTNYTAYKNNIYLPAKEKLNEVKTLYSKLKGSQNNDW